MMDKIRKRSFTNYQNSPQLQQILLNQILDQSFVQKSLNPNHQSQKNFKLSTLGFIKSKKAKIFNKFQKNYDGFPQDSTDNCNVSTIQSLKKQITALECDQIASYRLNVRKTAEKKNQQPKQDLSQSEISAIIKKFNIMKKQVMTDKFRKKFLLFNSSTIKTSIKTQQSTIKSERLSTKSNQIQMNKRKINLSETIFPTKRPNISEPQSLRSKSSMSLTARKFYEKKGNQRKRMTESCYNIYDRQKSIKKLDFPKNFLVKSVITL